MSLTELCAECGVPLMISKEQQWDSNGVIPLALNQKRRSVFYESDVVDGLFEELGELIGVPVDHMVIEFGSEEFRKLAEKLAEKGRQGSISLHGDILIEIDGEPVLIKSPAKK